MSELLARLKKNSTIKDSNSIDESKFFKLKATIATMVPNLNIALSGDINEGIKAGLLQICGKSKHFKTNMALVLAAAYLKKYKEAILMFFDSEFGASKKYFESFGIPLDRVLHIPVKNVEELKFELVKQLEEIKVSDHVFMLVDSVGNLASKKEVEDAKDLKSVADMSRAKALASMFRIITPYLKVKEIPLVVINHVYQTQELYSKTIVSGGEKIYLSSDDIWIITRAQEKDGTEVNGFTFTINIEKSRMVKEKSKIPITVMFDGGIQKHSGLLDLAIEMGFVIKPSNGWYSKVDIETGEVEDKKYRMKDVDEESLSWFEFMLKSETFKQKVRDKFQFGGSALIDSEEEYSAD